LVDVNFYTLFLDLFLKLTSAAPLTVDDIATRLELEKSQVSAWLKRATGDGKANNVAEAIEVSG
jgi:predicted transcriptional regulator